MRILKIILLPIMTWYAVPSTAQDTIVIGFGQQMANVTTSSGEGLQTLLQDGYLPNDNAASRFLSQAALGHRLTDIENLMTIGIEDWIDDQIATTVPDGVLLQAVRDYVTFVEAETGNSSNSTNRMWDYAWWNYHMTSSDPLRQKVAYCLSQLLVISENSNFNNVGYALADYYDVLLRHSLGNYRALLQEVTYHAAMGRYLTYLNNPKTDVVQNRFPDENYAREVMQLFTIGTTMLNMDGTEILDSLGQPIPTYTNDDISELSKIFTGLTWADRTSFYRGPARDTSYIASMIMFNDYHEPGPKTMIDGSIINSSPVDGDMEIDLALTSLYNHPNVAPFVSKFLISRMVTSNPPPAYVQRIAQVFVDDGAGQRGNLAAVVKAILLDPVAKACQSGDDPTFGGLREPFTRYMQINKAFHASTSSGVFRNDMSYVYNLTGQRPLTSPSVFNFYQQNYQPIGPVEDAGLVAPVFQITDAQSITGYINGLWRWVVNNDPADEYDIYGGEADSTYLDQRSSLVLLDEMAYADDDNLHILLDRINLVIAQGRLRQETISTIIATIREIPADLTDPDDREDRVRLAIYLAMTSPEYLINR